MVQKKSRREFLGKACKLAIVGGGGFVTACGFVTTQRGAVDTRLENSTPLDSSGERAGLYYQTREGNLGDPIPFFWQGRYHIFHVGSGEWGHIVSDDLLRWEKLPVAIARGGPGEPDSSQCASGSIIERDGTFHIFYLGRHDKDGRRVGTVCHATSDDLIHWRKNPRNPLLTPDYENYAGVTKDPFVFWNEEEQRYWMLISDRLRHAPTSRTGVLALAVSSDLENWERRPEPFWAPDSSTCEFEVPDLFEWNGRYYLTYTTYMEATGTYYRVAERASGPWLAPAVDSFDDQLYYAGKVLHAGQRHLAFAFVRSGEAGEHIPASDRRQALIIREVLQKPDGSLAFKPPEEFLRACGPEIAVKETSRLGQWSQHDHGWHGERLDGLAYSVAENFRANCLLNLTITLKPNTRSAGVLFRTTPNLERGYMLRLDPAHNRVVFERWPKSWPWKSEFWRNVAAARGQQPFMVQRSVHPSQFSWEEPIRIQLFFHDTIAEVFVQDELALVTRTYDHRDGDFALFVEHGAADFTELTLKPLP